jgi:hypothetical protein
MDKNQRRQYEMFVRVSDFGHANGDRFPASTKGGDAFAAVEAAVTALNQHTATQFSSRREARGGPSTDTAAYKAMVAMLDAIGHTAKAVAMDTAGVEGRFRVPKAHGKLAVVNAARAFARDVEPLAAQFVAHGMPADFVAQLTTRIAAVEQALQAREAGRELHASADASISAALDSGLAAVHRLDAIVGNVFVDDASAMAGWTVARRIDQYRGTKRGTTNGTTGSTTSSTTSSTEKPEAAAVTSDKPEATATQATKG